MNSGCFERSYAMNSGCLDKSAFKSLYALRYPKAKREYEINLNTRRAKMLEIVNMECSLVDKAAQQFIENRNQRREKLMAKLEEVRKLKELELQRLAQEGYRKQTTCNRDIYRPVLNELYTQDLKAQIEMNKTIKICTKLKDGALPSEKSLPIGLDSESKEEKLLRELKEDRKMCMSAREAKHSAMAEQKLIEAAEAREAEKLHLKEKEEAKKKAYEKMLSLRNMFEQQIEDKYKELRKQKEEEAKASAWIVSNSLQQELTLSAKSKQNKMLAKQRADEYLNCIRRVQKEKAMEEKAREQVLKKIAAKITEANETKRRQLTEASSALEKEVRETQVKQMLEKEGAYQEDGCVGGISFLDKLFSENDKVVERSRQIRELISRELEQQIQRRPATVHSTDWGSNDRDFTRPFRHPMEGEIGAYEYLNPVRKTKQTELDFQSRYC